MILQDDTPPISHVLKTAELPGSGSLEIRLEPGPAERAALAAELGLLGLRKLRLHGHLTPLGQTDWRLIADLGATVVQACVVTLEPVTTRIDEPVERIWRAGMAPVDTGDEVEIPDGPDEDPLGAEIDIGLVLTEALALALPLYPRAPGAAVAESAFAAPGQAPMTDDDAKPFAGLAGLRGRLAGGKDDDPGE